MQLFTEQPNRDREGASEQTSNSIGRSLTVAVRLLMLSAMFCPAVFAQVDRQAYLENEPLAEVDVQSLASQKDEAYPDQNVLGMYQREEEDPLSFYVRTLDGEWLIPAQVNPDDPWVRLLLLGPVRPTIVDVAIEIDEHPFRAAREHWIDKLLEEAKTTQLIRTGAATAEAAEIKETLEAESDENPNEDAVDQPESEMPMVAVQGRKTSTLFKRLINYLAADQSNAEHEASREELRWLLAEWTGGPTLLTLSPAFAWRRADVAPLWYALDRDGDQSLSSGEIQQCMATFKLADINQDDIVDLKELRRLGKKHAQHERTKGHPLVVVIDENTDWKALEKYLRSAYPQRDAQLSKLLFLTVPADVVIRVSFANEEAKAALLAVNGSDAESWRLLSSTEEVITVERAETYLELTAAQGKVVAENTSGDMQQTQVAIGAVVDGYPLFRLLDHDNNRQLTLRERRQVQEFLEALDRNHDGQIDRSELPTAIRLAVTHGPKVHEHLAKFVAAQRKSGDRVDSKAPAWFVGMDRNHDGDLSKREFQGSPVQFANFDRDGDDLISLAEVQDAEAKN